MQSPVLAWNMLSKEAREDLERQQYRIVGDHSAVKVCGWTKNLLRGRGGCYKLKFYGIMSHQCLQMSTSLSCANRCVFCWRGYKAPVSKGWRWNVDDPAMILDESLRAQAKLLIGYRGSDKVLARLYEQAGTVKHVALSLTGEPITYPRINDLLNLFNQRGISTFLVTNAQYPDAIRALAPVTQLYLSLDAATKELLKKVDVPLFADYWERLQESLDALAAKEGRTCIRLTAVKGLNMTHPADYAKLILKGDPDFLEVKAYMHVGASRLRLTADHMPLHEEVRDFARDVLAYLPDYEFVSEHFPSRVVMIAHKRFKQRGQWRTWLDFPAFKRLSLSGEPFTGLDYSKLTPKACLGVTDKKTPSKEESRARKLKREERYTKLRERLTTAKAKRAAEEGDENELE